MESNPVIQKNLCRILSFVKRLHESPIFFQQNYRYGLDTVKKKNHVTAQKKLLFKKKHKFTNEEP